MQKTSFALLLLALPWFVIVACSSSPTMTNPPPVNIQLVVQSAGAGAGTITSNPAGINCGSTCGASFSSGTAPPQPAASPDGNCPPRSGPHRADSHRKAQSLMQNLKTFVLTDCSSQSIIASSVS
jgi:hypothetical protein